jgi:valyl-tRNA synthetase
MMPFVTEELWSRLPGHRGLLATSPWAATQPEWHDADAEARIDLLKGVVTEARRLRAELSLDPKKRVRIVLVADDEERREQLASLRPLMLELARAEAIELEPSDPGIGQRLVGVVGDVQVLLSLEGVMDLDRERERLGKALDKVRADLDGLESRLGNSGFVDNAPEQVVARARERRIELTSEAEKLARQLELLRDSST